MRAGQSLEKQTKWVYRLSKLTKADGKFISKTQKDHDIL